MIYTGEFLNEISFPVGGIGCGCIGLAGNGSLIDWEIFNRPNKGSRNGYSHIAVKLKSQSGTYTKVLNSDLNTELTGHYEKSKFTGFGFGPSSMTMSGFPHFRRCVFTGEFPIAKLDFYDDDFPGPVSLTAFNPFIPLDSKNSSIPAAFYEISYTNDNKKPVDFQCAFSLANPFETSENSTVAQGDITSVKLSYAGKTQTDPGYGDISLSCIDPTFVQEYWYRGVWQDGISIFWNEFAYTDRLTERRYAQPGSFDTCSMLKSVTLSPGGTARIRFVISWNIPYNVNDWSEDETLKNRPWKNYYATVFPSSVSSGTYALRNWDMLQRRTAAFQEELFASTVDEAVKEAVSSTISVLKSPIIFRLENGEFYGFEGAHEQEGSCEGTCQHVYNYAYALCFLFPDLERSIRNLEFQYATYDSGATKFRLDLPLGKRDVNFRACVDGQMGCVIKTYREWKISGDHAWLKSVWPTVKKIMDYAWSEENKDEWDRNKDGVLEGRQHHTLDMELFGPSSWLQGFYLGALKAASEMADFLGDETKAEEYALLFEKGKAWTKENLFNGSYFIQKVDIKDSSIPAYFQCSDWYWNEETKEINYQIDQGCSIDQLTGQWHANICGLGALFDPTQVKTALRNMFQNNFKPSMRQLTNMWRVFALNDEGGAIICDYPEGTYKPRIPITYCEECMTGMEYQFAGLLISEGFLDEGLTVVKAIRQRYDGKKRNPWNEIECGSNYARAMASFALLPILSGFTFDLPHYKIGFHPAVSSEYFRCLWSLGTGWGYVEITKTCVRVKLQEGSLTLSCVDLPFVSSVKEVIVDGHPLPFTLDGSCILWERITIRDVLEILL